MMRTYCFPGEGQVEFEDSRSVGELLCHAFEAFGLEEPFGMGIVTLFQPRHSSGSMGWFTTDCSRSCAEEIEDPEWLCFAYHMPGVFYFAEGGWGHHMAELGNHPALEDPVSLRLSFPDFENTVVMNGSCRLRDIVEALERTGYLETRCGGVLAHAVYGDLKLRRRGECFIPRDDPAMDGKLTGLEAYLRERLEDPEAISSLTLRLQ